MSDSQEIRERKAEAAKAARIARFTKGLRGKKLVLDEIGEDVDLHAYGRTRATRHFHEEVAAHGGEVTEDQLRTMLESEERVPLRESFERDDS